MMHGSLESLRTNLCVRISQRKTAAEKYNIFIRNSCFSCWSTFPFRVTEVENSQSTST